MKTYEECRHEARQGLEASFEKERAFENVLRRHGMLPVPSEADAEVMREQGFEPWRPPLKGMGDEG